MKPETWHSVDQVMRQWPCTISVFIAHHLRCVGCVVGRHHTVDEACQAHAVDLQVFMDDLCHAVDGDWRRSRQAMQPQSPEALPSAATSSL
ncbi:hypothetical protein [Tianweitania sp.]|uniref:hypothetical protein n=1 Tax=Tianweitania sp. TaxID=2021634 RepID=UPI00289FE2FB|nr:hypothetical protein [Tianweitania sp.]